MDWRGRIKATPGILQAVLPGFLVSVTVAMAATFISDHHGGPTLLYALLVGMAFHFLSAVPRTKAGIEFSARTALRVGVALLGARIGFDQIVALGWTPVATIVLAVTATIVFGYGVSRLLGLDRMFGLLTAGAVAICGASAALAISAVLPAHKDSERQTIFTVVAVTALSTMAMVLYPLLVRVLGLDDRGAGIFLGGTIHDVAQVVGAGFIISETAGNVATLTKLMRVAMLVPVVLALTWLIAHWSRQTGAPARTAADGLPAFLVAFVVLVAVNSTGLIPPWLAESLSGISRWCLVIAIAAIGMKTSFQELATAGWQPAALMVAETVFLGAFVLAIVTRFGA